MAEKVWRVLGISSTKRYTVLSDQLLLYVTSCPGLKESMLLVFSPLITIDILLSSVDAIRLDEIFRHKDATLSGVNTLGEEALVATLVEAEILAAVNLTARFGYDLEEGAGVESAIADGATGGGGVLGCVGCSIHD